MLMRDFRRVQVRGKLVFVRVDINAEIVDGRVAGGARLQSVAPTISWLRRRGARIVLIAHRGRPNGITAALSLRPFVRPLARVLGSSVRFFDDSIFASALEKKLSLLKKGETALLENIRFYPEEEKNNTRLARRLAKLADVYVLDAFATAHRAHASIAGVRKFLPMYAGIVLQNEVQQLQRLLHRPARPFVALIGGAKISTKIGIVHALLQKTDFLLLGGALANTVLQAEGVAIGASLTEPSMIRKAKGLRASTAKLELPVDVVVLNKKRAHTVAVGQVRPGEKIVDIGPDTIDVFSRALAGAKTVVWNGPVGMFEQSPFDQGTIAIARALPTKGRRVIIAGGGETVEAIRQAKAEKKFTFLSTGGGAMLEFLEGKTLPGIQAVLHV